MIGDTFTVTKTSAGFGPEAPFFAFNAPAATPLTFSDELGDGSFIHVLSANGLGRFDDTGAALDEIIVRETFTTSTVDGVDSFAVELDVLSREIGTGSAGANAELGTLSQIVAAGTLIGPEADITVVTPLLDIGLTRFGDGVPGTDNLDVQFPILTSTGGAQGSDAFTFEGSGLEIFFTEGTIATVFAGDTDVPLDPSLDAGTGSFFTQTGSVAAFTPGFASGAPDVAASAISGLGVTFNFSTPVGLTGDFNGDETVDLADFLTFRDNQLADLDPAFFPGFVGNFGATESPALATVFSTSSVPEPTAAALLTIGLLGLASKRRRG